MPLSSLLTYYVYVNKESVQPRKPPLPNLKKNDFTYDLSEHQAWLQNVLPIQQQFYYCGQMNFSEKLNYPLVALKQGETQNDPTYTVLSDCVIDFPSEEARDFALTSAGLLEMLYAETPYILLPMNKILNT